ncbi:MAG TPA: uracil-DNA glycosylase [Anaerolineales bacterium]|nr:uracil-DNA glycosylase [Anaerolineales bacterium]
MNPEQELKSVADQVMLCTDCKLHASRKLAVPGEGPAKAELMFIGEGPGFHENEQGRPFVGAAGSFLEELLASIGMKRDQVYITNIVKCRPPGNRDPQPQEIEACSGYLERQIRSINPKVIVTLGRFSMARFIPNARISAIHGRAQAIGGRTVVAMYHPAAALHQPSLRRTIEQDFARLPALIAKAGHPAPTEQAPPASIEQLSLF